MATSISEMVRTSAPATRLERFAALVFVVALIVPGIALIAGVRPPELENATPATMPALSVGALTETATYAGIDTFIADNLPGRDVALRRYADLDYGLLGGSTNADVVVGAGDWLFFRGELLPTCGLTADEFLDRIDTAATDAEAAGLDLRIVVAPDKHVIHPERRRAGDGLPAACTDLQRDAVRAGMAARQDSTVDLWGPVLAARQERPEPIYFSQDSHWTPTGALAAIRALVDSLAPGVWDPAEIGTDGTSTYPMELARLMGDPRDAVVPAYVVRPTMTVMASTIPTDVDLSEAPEITAYSTTGDGAVIPGTTLFVYDSFFNINRPRIVPWFEDSIWVHVGDLRAHPDLVADLPPIDRVVVERVERDVYDLDVAKLLEPLFGRSGITP